MERQDSKTILVMSDSHGDQAVVEQIVHYYKDRVDAIFHNGDSELPFSARVWEEVQVVAGNCDYDEAYPDHLVTEVGDVRIAQTHGHLFGINYSWQRLDYWAEEVEADICLYGHLHAAHAEKRGDTLFLNPGSVLQPRGLVQKKLYALVTIKKDVFEVRFYDLSHQPYKALSEDFPR